MNKPNTYELVGGAHCGEEIHVPMPIPVGGKYYMPKNPGESMAPSDPSDPSDPPKRDVYICESEYTLVYLGET